MYINYSTGHATEYWHSEKMDPPRTDILNLISFEFRRQEEFQNSKTAMAL